MRTSILPEKNLNKTIWLEQLSINSLYRLTAVNSYYKNLITPYLKAMLAGPEWFFKRLTRDDKETLPYSAMLLLQRLERPEHEQDKIRIAQLLENDSSFLRNLFDKNAANGKALTLVVNAVTRLARMRLRRHDEIPYHYYALFCHDISELNEQTLYNEYAFGNHPAPVKAALHSICLLLKSMSPLNRQWNDVDCYPLNISGLILNSSNLKTYHNYHFNMHLLNNISIDLTCLIAVNVYLSSALKPGDHFAKKNLFGACFKSYIGRSPVLMSFENCDLRYSRFVNYKPSLLFNDCQDARFIQCAFNPVVLGLSDFTSADFLSCEIDIKECSHNLSKADDNADFSSIPFIFNDLSGLSFHHDLYEPSIRWLSREELESGLENRISTYQRIMLDKLTTKLGKLKDINVLGQLYPALTIKNHLLNLCLLPSTLSLDSCEASFSVTKAYHEFMHLLREAAIKLFTQENPEAVELTWQTSRLLLRLAEYKTPQRPLAKFSIYQDRDEKQQYFLALYRKFISNNDRKLVRVP